MTALPKATAGEDISGLRQPRWGDVRLRNAAELEFIAAAYDRHVFRARPKAGGWLTDTYLKDVYQEMFGAVWEWGGRFRSADLNIGVPWVQIPEQIRLLCDDFLHWDAEKGMDVFEVAARLQNRLTRIHPFKNGNGRHARLITDIFFHSHRLPIPEWPQLQRLPDGDAIRRGYIAAMRKADSEDFSELITFIKRYAAGHGL
jgi:Fic-DOC domain mobile mystery protein B